MLHNLYLRSLLYGILSSSLLLGLYFSVLSFISGWNFAQEQFAQFWYFIVSLTIGFGAQMGLYVYLKSLIQGGRGSGAIVGITGTTSTVAMISCCAHYLVNILPVLGVTGLVTIAAQYQTQFFWVGLLFNLGGIIFMVNRIVQFSAGNGSAMSERKL